MSLFNWNIDHRNFIRTSCHRSSLILCLYYVTQTLCIKRYVLSLLNDISSCFNQIIQWLYIPKVLHNLECNGVVHFNVTFAVTFHDGHGIVYLVNDIVDGESKVHLFDRFESLPLSTVTILKYQMSRQARGFRLKSWLWAQYRRHTLRCLWLDDVDRIGQWQVSFYKGPYYSSSRSAVYWVAGTGTKLAF